MAETLGMLCDKLTIVRLKLFHTTDEEKKASLHAQSGQLQQEIQEYISDAINGKIDPVKMVFDSNKVFAGDSNHVKEVTGDFGDLVSGLADVNCELWHQQEKVYEFEKVAVTEKDNVVKKLAVLNLERNKYIDRINKQFAELIRKKNHE